MYSISYFVTTVYRNIRAILNRPAEAQVKGKQYMYIRSRPCLKINERIEYKLLSLTYKVFTTNQPPYYYYYYYLL